MKPLKLIWHLEAKHPNHATKALDFFRRHEASLQRQRRDLAGSFHQENTALTQAPYAVAPEIVKQENLIRFEKRL